MQTVLLTHIDPLKKRYRFYRISLVPGFKVMQQWGRIGGPYKQLVKPFKDQETAQKYFTSQISSKEKKGYTRSSSTQIPSGKEKNCVWCRQPGPSQHDGHVVVPYPSHLPRRAQDMATRARWLAKVEEVAATIDGDPDVILPGGDHSIAIIMGTLPEASEVETLPLKPPKPQPIQLSFFPDEYRDTPPDTSADTQE